MPIELSLHAMTFAEKLQLMETLWDELSGRPSELKSPAWHQGILQECERRAKSGEEQFTDLEIAKKRIRDQVS